MESSTLPQRLAAGKFKNFPCKVVILWRYNRLHSSLAIVSRKQEYKSGAHSCSSAILLYWSSSWLFWDIESTQILAFLHYLLGKKRVSCQYLPTSCFPIELFMCYLSILRHHIDHNICRATLKLQGKIASVFNISDI